MSNKCELCGEPMPPGEEMFKFHGYSCDCPKPLVGSGKEEKVAANTVLVPVNPTVEQWGGLARDIMFVLRQDRPTPKKLYTHLGYLHTELPNWFTKELPDKESDHAISKGTCCVLIYKAMIAAAPK